MTTQKKKECRLCGPSQPIDAGLLAAHLDAYIETLAPEIRVTADEYETRLRICLACPHEQQFTCGYCGCYVQARAAKHALSCPDPSGPRWLRGTAQRRADE